MNRKYKNYLVNSVNPVKKKIIPLMLNPMRRNGNLHLMEFLEEKEIL